MPLFKPASSLGFNASNTGKLPLFDTSNRPIANDKEARLARLQRKALLDGAG
jgi:hypothetical protein